MGQLILPVFPLNIIAFPGEEVPLHIFEPRYRQLFNECEKDKITFVICPYIDGRNHYMGTEMRLIKIAKRYANGKMDVITKGINLVQINAFYKHMVDKLYGGAEIIRLKWDDKADISLSAIIIEKLQKLYAVVRINKIKLAPTEQFRTYHIAHKVGFSNEQELDFLALEKEIDRQKFMIKHLDQFLPIIIRAEEMKKKALLNGHFKDTRLR